MAKVKKKLLTREELLAKKEAAKDLFVRGSKTQKEIAKITGISEKTISDWKQAGKWDEQIKSITLTKEEQLKLLYSQLSELNGFISKKEEGRRYPDSKEADALKKITSAIKDLETELNIQTYIDVFIAVTSWQRSINTDKSRELADTFDQFIASII